MAKMFSIAASAFIFVTGKAAIAQADDSHITQITMERTACFGTCPCYKLTIYDDGTIDYEGKEYVKEKGHRRGKVSAENLKKIRDSIEKLHFFELKDRYDRKENPDGSITRVTDLPTCITTVTKGSQTKRVEDYFGGPKELEELERLIDEATASSSWIGRNK